MTCIMYFDAEKIDNYYVFITSSLFSTPKNPMKTKTNCKSEKCVSVQSLRRCHFMRNNYWIHYNIGIILFIIAYVNYSDVPKYKQRIAGKSLPMEKFAVKRSQRFTNQNNRLFMPAIELLYLWNLFKVFGKRKSLCDNLYRLIDKNTKDLEKNPGTVINQFIILFVHKLLLIVIRHIDIGRYLSIYYCSYNSQHWV